MCGFLLQHWEWLTGIVMGGIGAIISAKAYLYARRANRETSVLIKQSADDIVEKAVANVTSVKKEDVEDKIVAAAISEWRIKGQAVDYLRTEYGRLKDKGWTSEDFERIYKAVSQRYKGRPPKRHLFETES